MIKNTDFARTAENGGFLGTPYDTLDCQAFVEAVLRKCGHKYNWRGSNHMWRSALSWKGTAEEYREKFSADDIPVGAWLFKVKSDGGEKLRGYNDGEGNAAHVGIYLGGGKVIHSTTGGVQYADYNTDRFNRVGLAKMIDYYTTDIDETEISAIVAEILATLNRLEVLIDEFRNAGEDD